MQPESSQSQEPQAPVGEPAAEIKRPRKPIGKIILLILLILAVGGLGYWNYTLDANLKAAELSLAAMQSRHDALTTRNTKLTSDLGLTSAELEQTTTDLETTEASVKAAKLDLSKANGQVSSLESKKEKARQYTMILETVFTLPDSEIKGILLSLEISLLKDQELSKLYENYLKKPNPDTFREWFGYVIVKLDESLRK